MDTYKFKKKIMDIFQTRTQQMDSR